MNNHSMKTFTSSRSKVRKYVQREASKRFKIIKESKPKVQEKEETQACALCEIHSDNEMGDMFLAPKVAETDRIY